jgi:hypothetical protein
MISFFQPLTASFCLVFLKAFQNQNVIHSNYKSAIFTSFLIAMAEIAVILSAVKYGWDSVFPIGLGGAFGVVLAMLLHKKLFKRECK